MKSKRILAIIMTVIMAFSILPVASFATEQNTAVLSSSKFAINGSQVTVDSYSIEGYNYIKLRDIAALVRGTSAKFSINYDSSTKSVYLKNGESYTKTSDDLKSTADGYTRILPASWNLYVDEKQVNAKSYILDGYLYYKLSDLSTILNFDTKYDDSSKTVNIIVSGDYIPAIEDQGESILNPAQGNYAPITGYYTYTVAEGRTSVLYVSEGAHIKDYWTVIALPNTCSDTDKATAFLKECGWFDQMDKYGESFIAILPGDNGWGEAEDELSIIESAVSAESLKNKLSTIGSQYLVGYGEGSAAIELYAASTPLKVSAQVLIDNTGSDYSALELSGKKVFDNYSDGYVDEFTSVSYNEVPTPTWIIGDYNAESLEYWKQVNSVGKAQNTDYGTTYYEDKSTSRCVLTCYTDVKSIVAVKEDYLSYASLTDSIVEFLQGYYKFGSSSVYSSLLKERMVYEDYPSNIYVRDFNWTDPTTGVTWSREYTVYVPDSAAKLYPNGAPTVYAMHGAGEGSVCFFEYSAWTAVADKLGYIIVFPCGYGSKTSCGWSKVATGSYPSEKAPSDLEFLKSVISLVDGEFNTCGAERRYVSGQSAGSVFANTAGMFLGDMFTAVGSTSGATGITNITTADDGTESITFQEAYVSDGTGNGYTAAEEGNFTVPVYLIYGEHDHWYSAVEKLNSSDMDETFKTINGEYAGQKAAGGNLNEFYRAYTVIMYWLNRNGLDDAFSTDFVIDPDNYVITNDKNFGEADANGEYDYFSLVDADNPTHMRADGIDPYTTYTWYNESNVPLFQWSRSYGRDHDMTYADDWALALNWFEHWTMDSNGTRYYDGTSINS